MAMAAGRCLAVLRGAVAARAAAPVASAATAARRLKSTWHTPAINVEIPGAAQPRVEEKLVNVTFVNYSGERMTLPGRVGDSLYTLARRFKYEDVDPGCGGGGAPAEAFHKEGGWYEPKYGEGAACHFCHVIIPKSHYSMLPPKRPDETEQLASYPFPEDMTDTSRLACQVTLTKDMDGMLVYVPDGPPSDLP